jgi:hypothetical protein
MTALWPTITADRENLVKQQAELAEIQVTVRKTTQMIQTSQELIRQLDRMSDAAWRRGKLTKPS